MSVFAHNFELRRQHVAHGLNELEAAVGRLVAALAHERLWAHIEDATQEASGIRRACEAYAAIDYGMEDAVGSSVVCLGVIAASTDIVKHAKAVNRAKDALKDICAPLQRIRISIPVKGDAQATKTIPLIRAILRSIQRSDLNMLAAYRKIPLLDAPPESVTYTRANTRSVYRKSVAELGQLLANIEGPTALADRARLNQLDRRVEYLALVRPRYQNIRANVLYARLDSRGRGRIQVAAELPLIYATGRSQERPVVRFPEKGSPDAAVPQRMRRSTLEDLPFLAALPVYRYR